MKTKTTSKIKTNRTIRIRLTTAVRTTAKTAAKIVTARIAITKIRRRTKGGSTHCRFFVLFREFY